MSRPKKVPKLPVKQLIILSICRFAEPVVLTSVFPYLPEMIESFNVPQNDVAKWAGIASAVFNFAQCLTGVLWGRASDRFGRKPAILAGLTCNLVNSLLFGFSPSLAWAIAARASAGAGNGNVGILRTTVAELVPQKVLQPQAFMIMPLVWTVGSIFGPAFGGALAMPAQKYPGLFGDSKLLKRFPFALPNIVSAAFFIVGISTGILFMRETLASKKNRKDYGLILGDLLVSVFTGRKRPRKSACSKEAADAERQSEPLLRTRPPSYSTATADQKQQQSKSPSLSIKQVFTPQSSMNLLAYMLLALHTIAWDQLLPIFMHHPVQQIVGNPDVRLPFKFASGFGINSDRIGFLFTLYGFCGMIVQFFIFAPCASRFGILRCFKVVAVAFPFIYVLTCFTSLLPTPHARELAVFAVMMLRSVAGIFAFPCSTILLTNSARSVEVLGTLNGVATSVSAMGRAFGPAIGGTTFSWGVRRGYVTVAWFTVAGLAALGAVPVFFLKETDGLEQSEEEEEEEEDCVPSSSSSVRDVASPRDLSPHPAST